MNTWNRLTKSVGAAALCFAIAGCGGGGGGGSSDDDTVEFRGTVRSVLNEAPQANRAFSVIDLEKAADAPAVASGVSDSNGVFEIDIKGAIHVFIVFGKIDAAGEPRSSGLISLADGDAEKILKGDTDIACEAGVTAVRSGALAANLLTPARIANLEAGARRVMQTTAVDFNTPASVTAAAAQVRTLTNDGANPPP